MFYPCSMPAIQLTLVSWEEESCQQGSTWFWCLRLEEVAAEHIMSKRVLTKIEVYRVYIAYLGAAHWERVCLAAYTISVSAARLRTSSTYATCSLMKKKLQLQFHNHWDALVVATVTDEATEVDHRSVMLENDLTCKWFLFVINCSTVKVDQQIRQSA